MYVGLSGGIGSGKSTIAAMFAELGAIVIDADTVAKQVIEFGSPGFDQVVTTFGTSILGSNGMIDRSALANIVFADRAELTKLEQIIHPLVIAEVARIRDSAPVGSVVIYETPLLVEKQMMSDFDAVVMVLANHENRIERLVSKGLSLSDIENRIANQASDDERIAVANFIIHNDGTLSDAQSQVEKVWLALSS